MHNTWKRLIVKTLAFLVLSPLVSNISKAGQGSQDQETRTQPGPPLELQRKMHCLETQIHKWQEEGKDPQPIGSILQDFQPLMEQQKFEQAEQVMDRALEVAGGTCAGVPSSPSGAVSPKESGPSASLQEKVARLQGLVEQKQEDDANLRPFFDVMQGFGPLVQQKKYAEAEALVDRAMKILADSPPSPEKLAELHSPLIAFGSLDADGRQQIFAIKPDGTGKERLTDEGKRNFFPAWSPDGRKVAFTSDRSSNLQIWVMKGDGTTPRQLTTEGENTAPSWSPDGKQLAFASNRTGHFEIWVMEPDGTNQKQLTTTNATVANNDPAWSPDGRRIAFYSTQDGHSAIWLIDPDAGHLTQLTNTSGEKYRGSTAPAWSPDGKRIAFWSGLANGGGNIWVMNADGTNLTQLTNQPAGINCEDPAWSADGEKILFSSNRAGSEGIGDWIMDADGSHQKVFIANVNVWGRPSWRRVESNP